jgi:diketogulonate reductase-like aldo/keto reductase
MENEDIDFVQLPYSITLPDAERKLLPLAEKKKIAVLVNRPFEAGALFRNARSRTVPAWAAEFNCASWAEIFLRWIISHPAVTCVIPATSNPLHVSENLRAGEGEALTKSRREELQRRVMKG